VNEWVVAQSPPRVARISCQVVLVDVRSVALESKPRASALPFDCDPVSLDLLSRSVPASFYSSSSRYLELSISFR
jgi:hypothetical protein